MITFTNIPTYSAPLKVYQTAWSLGSNQQTNQVYNLTWKLPVDLGFRYLVRLHFCELEPTITESGQKQFDLLINNKIMETDADVIKWSSGNGVAVYRDCVVMMKGDQMECKRDLIIALKLKYESSTKKIDAIIKGIEIFKLSNPDDNLACVNCVVTTHALISRTPRLQKLVLAFGRIDTIATGIILVLTLLNFIVYHLNRLETNSCKINISSSLDEEELHRRFSLVEIQLATDNFDDGLVIGKGGFGKVYKGFIDRTSCVAIKRLHSQSKQGCQEFWAEIHALSKLRHNHLVSLIGYCDDCQEMILVYEYMAQGTLADHLHKASRNGSGNSPLSWEQRLNICIGAARGLEFLHMSSGAHRGIIHRDVKSSNILLDENWVAKISDFGLSKMDTANVSCSHISTNVKGTFGYLDPDYFMTKRLTKRSDVYAFGVVLLEVLCGRQAVDLKLEEEQRSLALWAGQCIQDGRIDLLVDPSVKEQISPNCLRGIAEIASKCLHDQPNKRPTMAEIVARLDLITLEMQRRADSYTEQEVIDVGGTCNMRIDCSITSEDPLSTPGHYSIPPMEVINESRMVESISPAGTTKNMEVRKWPGWRLWDSLWHRTRPSKKKAYDTLPKEYWRRFLNKKKYWRRFSLPDILAATNNFDDRLLINKGCDCKIYEGYIKKIGKVAIERYLPQICNPYGMRFEELSPFQCINVVSLVGYCDDVRERIVVREYMANGSLSDRLHSTKNDKPLSWKQRLQICISAARGLNYLHTGVVHTYIHGDVIKKLERTIIHRDVKPSNILFDQNWVAKIGGFGLCMLVPRGQMFITTKVAGTPGYVDPEYFYTSLFSKRCDVYSFGLVLLEVLCARKVVSMEVENERRILSTWALNCIEEGSVEQIIDPYLIGSIISPESLNVFVEIARKCLLPRGTERPSMTDVVRTLELALELHETADLALENEIARKCVSESGTEGPPMTDDVCKLQHALELQEFADGALEN